MVEERILRWPARRLAAGILLQCVPGDKFGRVIPAQARGSAPARWPGQPFCYASEMDAIRSAEIVTVGTELLLGEIVDTNSAFLASELAGHGVDVYWSLRVGDNLERVRQAIRAALERS